jgi:hypothetical protein
MESTSHRNFIIGATIVYVLLLLILFVFHDYPHYWTQRAGAIPNIIGVVFILVSYGIIFFGERIILPGHLGSLPGIAVVILLALGFMIACGFNFDLRGIPDIP